MAQTKGDCGISGVALESVVLAKGRVRVQVGPKPPQCCRCGPGKRRPRSRQSKETRSHANGRRLYQLDAARPVIAMDLFDIELAYELNGVRVDDLAWHHDREARRIRNDEIR